MSDKENFSAGLAKIRQKFLMKLKEGLPVFETFLEQVKNNKVNPKSLDENRNQVHKWAGTAQTFGFPELTKQATQIEYYLDRLIDGEALSDELSSDILELSVAFIKESKSIIRSELKEDELEFKPVASQKPTAHENNILVADDDELVREAIAEGLKDVDCGITYAENGKEVLQRLEQKGKANPDLIILDVNMPEMNGFEVLKAIKNNPEMQAIPVIMLTKRAEDESVIEGISAGAADYMTKPFSGEELKNRILSTLNKQETKVLVADDDELIRGLLRQRFNRMGYTVITAVNGSEALERMEQHKPNMTILDIMMPGMDGISVLKKVRSTPEISDLPIILLTAKTQQDNILHGLESGADDYIAKPFDMDEVAMRVSGILHRRRPT